MESTGAYWKPIFNVLEEVEGLQVVLANSQQVRNLRGHKTDPNDGRWLAHLLRRRMIRPSYIPPREIRELREFTRRRKQLVRAGAQERNRVQAVLEGANIKIGNVLTDIFGLSGQLMMELWWKAEQPPTKLLIWHRGKRGRRFRRYKLPSRDTA